MLDLRRGTVFAAIQAKVCPKCKTISDSIICYGLGLLIEAIVSILVRKRRRDERGAVTDSG
jgi:hypothetical protein